MLLPDSALPGDEQLCYRENSDQVIGPVQISKGCKDTSLTFQVWEISTLNLAHICSKQHSQVIVLVSLKASLLTLPKCRTVYFCVWIWKGLWYETYPAWPCKISSLCLWYFPFIIEVSALYLILTVSHPFLRCCENRAGSECFFWTWEWNTQQLPKFDRQLAECNPSKKRDEPHSS